MKKNLKKIFSSLLAAALVVGGAGVLPLNVHAEGETIAYLSFADNGWAVQYWNDGNDYSPVVANNVEVTGYGQYTVSLDFTGAGGAPDIAFFDVEISNGEEAFPNSYMTIDSVKVNGEEVALTGTPYTSSDNGVDTRTNLYNAWVPDATTVDNARTADGSADGITPTPVDGASITAIDTIEVTFTLGDGVLCNASSGEAGEAVLSEESYPAFIAFGGDAAEENDWGFQYYGDGAGSNAGDVVATNGELKSGETTTLSLEFSSPVVNTWFVAPCMIADDASAIAAESTFDVKVYLDDAEVAVDLAAGDVFWAEGTGDYGVEQCIRIAGGFNEWGTAYIEEPAGFSKITFEITPTIYVSGAPAEEETSSAGSVDLNGTYHAYLGFQTPVYSFRNAFDDATYGRDSEYFNQVTGWEGSDAVVLPGTFTDVEIAGNGTYTVSVEELNFPSGEFDSQDYMNLIFLSTDIPNSGEITISDVVLKVDGKSVELASAGAIVSPDSKDYLNILLQNIWNDKVKEIGYYNTPMTSMSITFTVSGFAYDAAPAEEAPSGDTAPATSAEPVAAPEEGGSNTGLIVGIVAAVVVVAGGAAGVVVAKKKKGDK